MPLLTLLEVLRKTQDYLTSKGITEARLEAEYLLGHVLDMKRLDLYLSHDRPMADQELEALRELLKRRGRREPLQHILGEVEFMGLTFKVSPAALIPRQETEQLVSRVLDFSNGRALKVLDIGTGNGCIAIALAKLNPELQILALDISRSALELARENARRLRVQARVSFQQLDILLELPHLEERLDVVVSNPPYISNQEKSRLQPEVVKFEPPEALFAGDDGLLFYRRFVEILPRLLRPGGHFFFEIGGQAQAQPVMNLFLDAGYQQLEIFSDYLHQPRILKGCYNP